MEMNFKTYIGTKTVKAVPMKKAQAEKALGKSITPATPGENGYLVEYPDGYRSWSPAEVFEDSYKVAETHVDRMKIELADLNERICKATRAINTFGAIPEDDRWQLKDQVNAMQKYAVILYNRIGRAVEPCSVASSESPCCSADTKEGGDQ